MRHRESVMRAGCQHLLRVQKALDQMNVQLHHAITDITGQRGLATLDAIVAGERDPEALARLRHYRCKKSEVEIAKALRGDWRAEHLFTLRQSLEAWRFHQQLMADCDQQIASRMDALEDRGAGLAPVTRKKGNKPHEEPMREQLCGPSRERSSHGGTVPPPVEGGTGRLVPKVESQARNKGGGDRCRPKPSGARQPNGGAFARRAPQGGGNLARILWAIVRHRRPYDPKRLGNPELARARKERYLRRQAEQLGFALTPVNGEVS